MKILYLLFTFLFLAFLSEPGNAQRLCLRRGGHCFGYQCPGGFLDLGQLDCPRQFTCCKRTRRK
ncbi:beta-defensin-like [Crotalus adamanteus]|uniref:Beta-defensin-like n=1 Tax=Crotalus adamanteus TaxID=8729 RepID=A0AAW1BT96_CROAD